MTRREFIKQLDFLIQDLDAQDRSDLLNYYRDYLDEAGIYNFNVEDGSKVPKIYGASTIDDDVFEEKEDSVETKEESKSSHWGKLLLIIGLCVIGLPIILGLGSGVLGLLAGIVGLILSLIFGVAGTAAASLIGGIVLLVLGISQVSVAVPQGIFMIGLAMVLFSIGILAALLTVVVFKRWIPWCIRTIKDFIKSISRRNGGAES